MSNETETNAESELDAASGSPYPTAEEELKVMTTRFWNQVEVTEKVVKERDEAREECESWRGRFIDERIRFPWENVKAQGCEPTERKT